ncbi:MAG: chromosome segregation protein SMC [Pirellulales bacterium]|nr:chromosome segregation protein SMC [Pirellulales bacterium]
MLKALELSGFKSFADKTRFEFPPGITVVVGPNGSGKSNVVDAIKWVLGEQSVKSLRGKEMADVIFNGSHSRRPLNTAEAILTFDNSDGRLPIDTPEVHVGRRVYRSGEGEYLINGNACRLRDVRDLFAGTGVSTQAYSIIEQGKVDVMLQASPRDRRLIFEEAAGISRFKAKKLETIRRLDRVDQNLLRLSDIVDEVDSRLRNVRKQAGKAQKYREHTTRLQQLRTQVAQTDWKHLTETLDDHEQTLATLATQIATNGEGVESHEAMLLSLEQDLAQAEDAIRQGDRQVAENRGELAACETTTEHQRSHLVDLRQEIARRRNQVVALTTRTRDLDDQLETTTQEVEVAREAYERNVAAVARIEEKLAEALAACQSLRVELDTRRAAQLRCVQQNSELGNEITSLKTRLESEGKACEQAEEKLQSLDEARRITAQELAVLAEEEDALSGQLKEAEAKDENVREELKHSQAHLTEQQRAVASLRELRSGLHEREMVLEELERQFEGLSAGTRQILMDPDRSDGTLGDVRGLIADIFEVQVDVAPMVEIALGEKAGFLLSASGQSLREFLLEQAYVFEGRVGFMASDRDGILPQAQQAKEAQVDLAGESGVIGRADAFVQAPAEYADFVRRLLGATWFVERLSDAVDLKGRYPGQSFVARDGSYLGNDGSICVGPRMQRAGLISRRSELRDLKKQIADLEENLASGEGMLERLEGEVADATARLEATGQAKETLAQSVAECRRERSAIDQRKKQQDEQQESTSAELTRTRSARDAVSTDLALFRDRRAENDAELAELERLLKFDQCRLDELERQRQACVGDATAAKVELARSEQSLDSLSARMHQFQQDHNERQKTIEETRQSLSEAESGAETCEQEILRLEGESASLHLRQEELENENSKLNADREALRAKRGTLQVDLQKLRAEVRRLETEKHTEELAAGEIRHQRDALAERMLEDYGIELTKLNEPEHAEFEEEREGVENEIAELRRKIDVIGNVNLDALEELEGLETRHHDLAAQLEDLTQAKRALEQIIERINADSRRLFIETLETVRGHFQGLFRKLFGGGHADIVIEDEADILESGLEIVARPPGKEPRSISLLSGGEKTLTCVACLLAIFRSRPSPFCVLDEVDAALDEANIERFISVLNEFLQWTQFIVVTHSKKTMACGGTLYGVTMQESGISKQVSVRFEDVSETGEILKSSEEDDGTQAA